MNSWRTGCGFAAALAGVLAFGSITPRKTQDPPSAYPQLLRSTVMIVTPTQNKGVGWIVDRKQRWVVTNYHVVGDHDTVEVLFPAYEHGRLVAARTYYRDQHRPLEANGRIVRGRVLHKEADCDLALIELSSMPDDARELPLASESPRPGDVVHSIGCRSDLDVIWTHAAGSVRQVLRTQEGYFWRGQRLARGARIIVTTAPINDGDSGGPLVNTRGELVGVLAAVQWQAPLAGVAVDVSELHTFLLRCGAKPVVQESPRREESTLYQRTLRAVAWIKSGDSGNRATGWLCDRERKLLLATHQAAGARDAVDVIFPVVQNGRVVAEHSFYRDNRRLLEQRGHQVRGHVVARDARRNLALIELDRLPDDAMALELSERPPSPGEPVHTIGNPNGIEALWVYSAGSVRQWGHALLDATDERPHPSVVLVQFPGSANDSGGPVVDHAGRLIGMISGKEAPQQLVSYCLDVREISAFLYESRPRWDPRTAADQQERGRMHLRLGQYDRALVAFTAAIQLAPADAVLFTERAHAHWRRGDAERVLADAAEALRLEPRLAAAHTCRAAGLLLKGNFNGAIADCDVALKLDPKYLTALAHRANAYRLKGGHERALADADEAIWLDARLALAYYYRGLLMMESGELDRALTDLGRAVDLDPHDRHALRARGEVHRKRNELDKALLDFNRAVELDASDADAYHGRGLTLALVHRHEAAIADYSRALQLKPSFARAYLSRGVSAMRQDDSGRAVADFQEAITRQRSLTVEVLREAQSRASELARGERADVARSNDLCRRVLDLMKAMVDSSEAKKAIADGLSAADRESDLRERGQILRAAISDLRK